jgi:hypothetical protein
VDTSFRDYFIDVFPDKSRNKFFGFDDNSFEKLLYLRNILLRIYRVFNIETLPLDKYDKKRIKHFKSMFGTFEKEFSSHDFILDNLQNVQGTTEYISCEDFKTKLDTLYNDGYRPISYEKCNMIGLYSHTSVSINELSTKLKDFTQLVIENNPSQSFCRSLSNNCETYGTLELNYFFHSRSSSVQRTISDIYFIKMIHDTDNSVKWVPMFSVMFHMSSAAGIFPKLFENNLHTDLDLTSSPTLISALNNNIIKHIEIEPMKNITSRGKGFLIYSSASTTEHSNVFVVKVVKIDISGLDYSFQIVQHENSDKLSSMLNIIRETNDNYESTIHNETILKSIVLYSSPTTRDFDQVTFENENTSLQILHRSTVSD